MAGGMLSGSVVAIMKMAQSGGSSRVLRMALKAASVIWWASSRRKILYLSRAGRTSAWEQMERTSSMPRLEAASISMKSKEWEDRLSPLALPPEEISRQETHWRQGSTV